MTGALSNKDYSGLLTELKDQGWDLERTGKGHWKATPPDPSKAVVIFSETRDFHGYLNTIREMQNQGFVWPPRSKAEAKSQRRRETDDEVLADVLPIVRAAPFPPKPLDLPPASVPVAPAPKSEQQLFRELLDAKEIERMAKQVFDEVGRERDAVQRKFEIAAREFEDAREDKIRAKAAFDAAFEVTP